MHALLGLSAICPFTCKKIISPLISFVHVSHSDYTITIRCLILSLFHSHFISHPIFHASLYLHINMSLMSIWKEHIYRITWVIIHCNHQLYRRSLHIHGSSILVPTLRLNHLTFLKPSHIPPTIKDQLPQFYIKLGYKYTYNPRTYPSGLFHSLIPHLVFAHKRDTLLFFMYF